MKGNKEMVDAKVCDKENLLWQFTVADPVGSLLALSHCMTVLTII